MKINGEIINNDLEINKIQIQQAISPATKKLDTSGFDTVIQPFIPVSVAQNLILQNTKLDKSIHILSQDTILNKFSFLSNTNEDNTQILKFWENNIDEVFKQVKEYYSYGFGASEITFDEDGNPKRLYQIPSETLFISQESNYDGTYSYYAIQKINGKTIKMRLSRYNYTEEDDDLPVCWWLGKGRTSEFYEIPYWLPAFNSISAKVALDGLNRKKINEGNLLSGILTFVTPPLTKNQEDPDKSLKDQMEAAGTGILTLHLKQYDEDIPLDIKYIPITESNYDYLTELSQNCEQDIMTCFGIPKIRYMIDDIKESMNSNKSDTIYEIYCKSLAVEQMPFEKEINQFNRKYFKFTGIIDIEVPIFADKKETEVKSILNLFDKGILTLGQAITALAKYYPELNLDNINTTNPIFNERYYNGKILGLGGDSNSNSIGDIDELLELFQD